MTITEIEEKLNSLQEQLNSLIVSLTNYATTDDLIALTDQIKSLQNNNSVLQQSLSTVENKVSSIHTIHGLLDFDLDDQNTPLTNGDILRYDNGKWHNIQLETLGITGGGTSATSLATLSDVIITDPTHGQVLAYNGTSGKWMNTNISSGSGDMSGYLTIAMAEATYFKKTGGTITGDVTINGDLLVKGMITGEDNLLVHGGVTMYGGL